MEFVAIDFETTGYENGATNEPWQLGLAIVRDGLLVDTREWFFRTTTLPDDAAGRRVPDSDAASCHFGDAASCRVKKMMSISDAASCHFGDAASCRVKKMMSISETTITESFPDWSPLLMGHRLVAHNIATERTILTRIAPLTKWGPWVDTLKLAKARYPHQSSYALGDLCAAFGLVPTVADAPALAGRTWHDGLYDAVACARLATFLSF